MASDEQPESAEPTSTDETPPRGSSLTWCRPVRQPPGSRAVSEIALLFGMAALLMLGTALVGWLGGSVHRQIDVAWRMDAIGARLQKAGADDIGARLAATEAVLALQPDSPVAHLQAASAYLLAAEAAEGGERTDLAAAAAYRQEARAAADMAEAILAKGQEGRSAPSPGSSAFDLHLQRAIILSMAGEEERAIRLYDTLMAKAGPRPKGMAEARAWARLHNNFAWLLITAEDESLRDPPRGHAFARAAVKAFPAASQYPSYLDTLAMTYYGIGNAARAVHVQRRALALARTNDVPDCIANLDMFEKALADKEGKARYGNDD